MRGRIQRIDQAQKSGVPIIGKIKIGEKTKNAAGTEYPTSLDYFKATGKYESYFRDAYGEKPSEIQVAFISDSVSDVCDERFEIRDTEGRLYARGDGELFEVWDASYDSYVDIYKSEHPDLVKEISRKLRTKWYTVITLRFLLPKIRGVIGQWQLSTKGQASSIPAIRDAFDFVQLRGGTVINVPFDLQVEKVKSQKPGKKSVYPVLNLVPNVSSSHLEMLSRFLESGEDVRSLGLLTEERIESMTPTRLVEHAELDGEEK